MGVIIRYKLSATHTLFSLLFVHFQLKKDQKRKFLYENHSEKENKKRKRGIKQGKNEGHTSPYPLHLTKGRLLPQKGSKNLVLVKKCQKFGRSSAVRRLFLRKAVKNDNTGALRAQFINIYS